MSVVDGGAEPAGYALGFACVALVCLFLVSAVVLVLVLVRRNRRRSG